MNAVAVVPMHTPVVAMVAAAVVLIGSLGCLWFTRNRPNLSQAVVVTLIVAAVASVFVLGPNIVSIGSTDWAATEDAVEDAYGITIMDFNQVNDGYTEPVRVREGDELVEAVIARAGDDLTLYRPADANGDLVEWAPAR